MIREVVFLSSWFILAGALPVTLPDIIDDADIFSDLTLQGELKPTADPASATDFDPAEVVKLIIDLGPSDAVLSPTVLDPPDALKLNTGLYFTGAEVPAVDLDPADVLMLNTSLHLSGTAVSTDDLESTPTVEFTIDLLPADFIERTTDVNLDTTQALKLFIDLEPQITRFMEETTDGATASGIGDYLEEPPTGKLEEPNTSRECDKFIPKLN